MAHLYDLDGTTLIARYFETISVPDVERAQQEVARDPRYDQVTSILIDLTGVEAVDFTKSKTLEASFITRAIFNKTKKMKLAVASTHSELQGFVKIFLDDFADTGWNVKGFESADDAFKWLSS